MDIVPQVRAFNRFYTSVIGVLGAGMHDTPYSLTEARVLFELGTREQAADAADIRGMLGLDAGYLSRILSRFETDGLVSREKSPEDARRQVIRLTPKGRETFAMIDRRSAAEIDALVEKLADPERRRLVSAMDTVKRLLEPPAQRREPYVIRPPRPGDLGWVVQRHGALYSEEYGWGASFEAYVIRILAAYLDDHDPRREAGWIAEVAGEPVGCVFCACEDETTARLRLLLVEPSARGMGIGGRLVEECLRFATAAGYRRITLLTRDVLLGARRIYQAAGFTLADRYPGEESGVPIVEEVWTRDL
ncbi:MarR family transcriptional regulator [Microbispora tritici]|uniref:MarR family transcriptional regulator n=2 Tax=Microbispora TaxID=2005 RepID=A0ABY3LYR4_9ACTN|nr:MarR family transcriptional regulator [Microbispora fusca]TYB59355.1 MarR family transcriptional regulator [Microbispora tritici]